MPDMSWTWDGESDYTIWVAPAPVIDSVTADAPSPWYGGESHTIDIYGSGFTQAWIWGCSGIDQSSFTVNSTHVSGSLHVALRDNVCTIYVIVDAVLAATIVLRPPAQFRVEYVSYIQVDHIRGPTTCQFIGFFPFKIYKGDAYRGTYRTGQAQTVVPEAGFGLNYFADTGYTNNYGYGSPVANLTLSYLDEDGIPNDCYKWNEQGKSTEAPSWSVSGNYGTHQGSVGFAGTGHNPLEPRFGGISWGIVVTVDTTNANDPKAKVTFDHTCYPAHQVKVNGSIIYSYPPPSDEPDYIVECLTGVRPGITGATGFVSVPKQ